ncbi:MAG: hypothetical protein Q8N99_02870 [Nanoarchaeota archaeon]|nr:hypothetical protein [Nanoarchaeota archaeon]
MKKVSIILLVIAVVWLLLIVGFELTIGQIFCPSACDMKTGVCGCDLFPNHPLRDILVNGGIPALILTILPLILNSVRKPSK